MRRSQSLASEDFPLDSFLVLVFCLNRLIKDFSGRWNNFTHPKMHWDVWSVFKKRWHEVSLSLLPKGKNTSGRNSQVNFCNSTPLWRNCDHSAVARFATRNGNTYTNQTPLLMVRGNFRHFWKVLQFRAVRMKKKNTATVLLFSFDVS